MPQAFFAGIWSVLFLAPLLGHAEFYTFEENSKPQWQDPATLIAEMATTTVSLLKWSHHTSTRPVALEKYIRLKHFGTWVDDFRTPECYETRALILMRDNVGPIKMSPHNPCKVYSGEWHDPYSGNVIKIASPEIEIDHTVALKNAYDSGAFAWDYQHRCLFANFTGYENHLLSVSISENRAKSDRSPAGWMPSDRNYACQHLQNWLAVKFIWNLNMTPEESAAIQELIENENCNIKKFQFSKSELRRIKKFAQENLEMCAAKAEN